MPAPDDSQTAQTPLVRRNEWRSLAALPAQEPTLSVSVVIPAHRSDATLPAVLAGLAHQTWPAHLLEVVVAADGDAPTLPDVRPERTRLVTVEPATGWGPSVARRTGALAADGDVLLFLDADMLVPADHVAAHAQWQQRSLEAVTIGHKLFVGDWRSVGFDEILRAAADHTVPDLYHGFEQDDHWIDDVIEETDELNDVDHRAYRVVVGASLGVHRRLYDDAGGFDPLLRRGEDSELGSRLAQAGAVLVPERTSTAWHLGAPTVRTRGDDARRYNRPYLAQRMPQSRWLRSTPGRVWEVPLVRAVVEVGDSSFEVARACVDRLLMNDEEDLQVALVGPWDRLADVRRNVLDDPDRDLRMVHEWYRTEPRVALVEEAPSDVFPVPFRLDVAVDVGARRDTVRRLLTTANRGRVGRVQVPALRAGGDPAMTLTRTAALSRARRQGSVDDATLDAVWGLHRFEAAELGLVDLTDAGAADELPSWTRRRRSPGADGERGAGRSGRLLAGLRRRAARAARRMRSSARAVGQS